MTLAVIDASVVVRWFVADDPLHTQALDAKVRFETAAPALIQAETANALWRFVRVGRLDVEDACESVAVLPGLIRLTEDREVIAAAQRLSAALNHPVYDCLYLALARREAVGLVTADRRLAELSRTAGTDTHLLSIA